MTHFLFDSAVRSNVGLVRKNNQDSGFAGPNFLLIADGMGGHAGGDVASAITVGRLSDLNREDHASEALEHLRQAILEANDRITNAVTEKPELAGMGTTVTALLRSDDRLALAHIGDSRAYLLREDSFSQLTADHTFVQMLVDEGRITPEEAEHHPQRSVVMRVLGDVGAAPEIDLSIREARVGDRWLLCSDGLTGFASQHDIEEALRTISDPGACAEALVDLALEGGGADNITVVIGDVVEPTDDLAAAQGESAGSIAINPQFALLGHNDTPTVRIDEIPVDDHDDDVASTHANSAAAVNKDTEALEADAQSSAVLAASAGAAGASTAGAVVTDSAADDEAGASGTITPGGASDAEDYSDSEFSDELFEDRPHRGWIRAVIAGAVVLALAAAVFMGWQFIQSQYYVTAQNGNVVVYQGISQSLGPIQFSTLSEQTDIAVSDLPSYTQHRLESTIPAPSRDSASQIVETLREEAAQNTQNSVSGGASDSQTADPAPTKGSPSAGASDSQPGGSDETGGNR